MSFTPGPGPGPGIPPLHGTAAVPAATLALAIDALAWPLLLLHGDGVLLHANRAGQALLRRGRPLALTARHLLQPSQEAQQGAFRAALGAVAGGAAPQRLAWADDEGRAPMSGRLSALPPEPGQPPVLMLTLDPEAGPGTDLSAFAAAHGLSPTETRVLQRLALGESSARAATVLGLQATTVRTHALSLRRKTGHASIGALVHALARQAPIAPITAAAPAPPQGE